MGACCKGEVSWLPKSTPADLVYLFFKEQSDLLEMEEQVKNLKVKIKKSKEALKWIEHSANEWYDDEEIDEHDEAAELEEQTPSRYSKSKSTPESASSSGSGAARGTHTKF